MPLLPRGLYGRLILSVSLVITAVIVLFGFVTFRHQAARMEESARTTLSRTAKNLSLVCADYLLIDDYASLEVYLKRFAELPNILEIEVTDAAGKRVAHVAREGGTPRVRFTELGQVVRGKPEEHTPRVTAERNALHIWHPMSESGMLGWVHLSLSTVEIDVLRAIVLKNTAAASIIGLMIGLVALMLVLRPHARAVRYIAAFANRLKEKKGDEMAVQYGALELEELSRALNDTSRKLCEGDQDILSHQRDLEEKTNKLSRELDERIRAEVKLARSTEELREVHEDLRSFVYSASHDLRGPLVSIKGFTEELKQGLELDRPLHEGGAARPDETERERAHETVRSTVPEALAYISSAVDRMDDLISAMLKLSRLSRRELKREPIDLNRMVGILLAGMEERIINQGVIVRVGELPLIVADRDFMEHIVGHLLDNALKYFAEQRPGVLEIFGEQGQEDTILHIRDNGRGISADDLPKIFEMFRRVGHHDVPGVGMGLTYVKTLVRRHGGRIWCESQPGEGSTFSFSIPRRGESERDPGRESSVKNGMDSRD